MKGNKPQRWTRTIALARTRASALLMILLSCFTVACNPSSQSSSSPASTSGQIVYVLSLSHPTQQTYTPITVTLTALSGGSGQRLWRRAIETRLDVTAGYTLITRSGSTLYVSISGIAAPASPGIPQDGEYGEIIALDTQAGKTLWKAAVDGIEIQRLTVGANGHLYIRVDEHVEALDGASGARLWSVATDQYYQLDQFVATNNAVYEVEDLRSVYQNGYGAPADRIVLRALRLKDGHEIWRQGVTTSDALVSIQADEQAVYLLRAEAVVTLYALHARDGSPLWSDQIEQGDAGDLYLSSQILYVRRGVTSADISGVRSLSAFQSQNGARLWAWQAPLALTPYEPPDHIYGSSLNKGQNLCPLRKSDGSIAWCAGYNLSGPALFGEGRIYMVAFKISNQIFPSSHSSEQLYILNESDGRQVAQYSPGDTSTTTIVDIALS